MTDKLLTEGKTLREMDRLRRHDALHGGQWQAVGEELYEEKSFYERSYLGRMRDSKLAAFVAALHNIFLPLANLLVFGAKKAADRKNMDKELER